MTVAKLIRFYNKQGKHSLRRNNTYPVHRAEVDCLRKVKALIEAAVVGSRKRDHKLSGTLVCSVNLNDDKESMLREREQGIGQINISHRLDRLRVYMWVRTGTPWAIRVLGFMMVTSWCSRSGWDSNSSGASFLITASSCSAAKPGAPYQVLGSPLKRTGHTPTKVKYQTTSSKHEHHGKLFRSIQYQCR